MSLRVCVLLVGLTIRSVHALRARPFVTWAVPLRAPAARCAKVITCSTAVPYTDLESIAEAAYGATRAAMLRGKRALEIEAPFPVLDVSDQAGYDAASLARFALWVLRAAVALDGPLLLLLPCSESARAARSLAGNAAAWPPEDIERLQIVALNGDEGGDEDRYADEDPEETAEVPAAVLVAGLGVGGATLDERSRRLACARLRGAKASICLNGGARLLLPFERSRYETIFAAVPMAITREVLRFPGVARGARGYSERIWIETPTAALGRTADLDAVASEPLGRALVSRAYPGPWHVLLDAGSSGEYEELAELVSQPNGREISEMVEPIVKARRAALSSALKALLEAPAAQPEEAGREAGRGAGRGAGVAAAVDEVARPLSVAGGVGSEAMAEGTVVCLRWEEIKGRSGAGPSEATRRALSLYQAVALLRQRCYGAAASYAHDEEGVHILQPYSPDEASAARARTTAVGRLDGDVRGACLLVPEAGGAGVARLEQLSVQQDSPPDERAECAASLLERAVVEARALAQTCLVVAPLPARQSVEGARWLEAAGFASCAEGAPTAAAAVPAAEAGAMCIWL